MTDPLSTVSPVMEILRRQMAENLDRLRKSATAGGTASGARALPQLGSRPVTPTLRQTLARRVKSLDTDDPQFQGKATALFVESILLSEFGEGMINDPEFRLVIREVAATMSTQPAIANDLAVLFAELAATG